MRGRSELPSYVQRYMQGEFKLDDFITHTMPLEQINEGVRSDARRQEHPHRHPLLIHERPAHRMGGARSPL